MRLFRMWWLLAVFLFVAQPAIAQMNCDAVVSDEAGVLTGKMPAVEAAAATLINEGADVRILTVQHSVNADMTEHDYQTACKSWRSPSGITKSTLIVMIAAPKDRKMGLYYGSAWHHALDNSWVDLKKNYMGPHFADGDFAAGFIAVTAQLTRRLQASKDEAQHPIVAQTTNVQQPTDLSGLWHVLGWALGLMFLGFLAYGLYWALSAGKRIKQRTADAQQRAIGVRASIAARLLSLKNMVASATALNHPNAAAAEKALGLVTEHYAGYASQERMDPSQEGLTADGYVELANTYSDLTEELDEVEELLSTEMPDDAPEVPEPAPHYKYGTPHSNHENVVARRPSEQSTPSHDSTVVVPIPIPYEREHESREDDSPRYSPSPSHESEDTGGGGSSSFGGGDDDSGGGSSGFGGGDSGGGGGSGFGGGDSGGGGGSDF